MKIPIQKRTTIKVKMVREPCGQKIRVTKLAKEINGLHVAKNKDINKFSHGQSVRPENSSQKNYNTQERSGKRNHSPTAVDKAPERACLDVNFACKENSELSSELIDGSKQERPHNAQSTKKCIPHHFMKLMYQLDLAVLCSLSKRKYEHKYPFLSVSLEDSKINKFNDITLHNEKNSIHVQIEIVHKYYTNDDINYAKLFNKGERFSLNNYFDSFVKCVTSEVESASESMKCFIVYTNANLDLTDQGELKKIRSRKFYPFKFDRVRIEDYDILHDLFTNGNGQGCNLYQFSQNKDTREELLKRLDFSSAAQNIMRERNFSPNKFKEMFLDSLVFAINQPSREELNGIIKCEIEKHFKDQHNYIALHEEMCQLMASERGMKVGSEVMFGFNMLKLFVHNMFMYDNMISVNFKNCCPFNDICINFKDKFTHIAAYHASGVIGFGQLFPSRRQERNNAHAVNKHFALCIAEIEKDLSHFILYTNTELDLNDENKLNHRKSTPFYSLKFDHIDVNDREYKSLKKYLCLNKDGLYRFTEEEIVRKNLLSLLELPPLKEQDAVLCDEQFIKEQYLDKLIFASNQPDEQELNNITKANVNESAVPYDYQDLHEITLRWLESHEFDHITKMIMDKLLEDVRNNKFSSQKIVPNIDEEVKFATSVVGTKGTPAFDEFLIFLIKGKGKEYLKILKKEGISLANISSIIGGAKGKSSIVFKGLFELWFDDNGKRTRYLKTLEKEGINLSNISSILNRAKGKAPAAFKDLYNLWFDEDGNKTQYLKTLEREGVNLATMSSILSGSRAAAAGAFKDLYCLWFDEHGDKTQYLKNLESEKINLTSVSSVLSGAGANAVAAFKDLYGLWFDKCGNKTEYLILLKRERLNLSNMSSILSGAGVNAAAACKELFHLWFDEKGNKTPYLKTLEEEGINLNNASSILHGAGARAATSFRGLYDLWFHDDGGKTRYLRSLEDAGIDLINVSSILHGAGGDAHAAFKALYLVWFDECGNKTQYLKSLEEAGVGLSNMTNILHGAGMNAAVAYKNLYNLWFDANGKRSLHLKNLKDKGLDLSNMSSILGGSGVNIATAFKDLYDLWLDNEGNATRYIRTLDREGVSLANVASILGGAGVNAATAFQDLYDLWFVEEANKPKYLDVLKREKINLSNISSILHGAGDNAATAFRNLFELLFDEGGVKGRRLRALEGGGVPLASVAGVLNGAGREAARAFAGLCALWFDERGEKTRYLRLLERDGIGLSNVSSILHGAGDNAAKAFKQLFDSFFDEWGNRQRHLKHFLTEDHGRGKNFKLRNFSSILSRTGTRARYAFEKLHDVCFDEDGKRTKLLEDFYNAGFAPSNLSSALFGAGARAATVLTRLHSVCFLADGEGTKYLEDFFKVGFGPGNLCSMLSGAAAGLDKKLREFHEFCFVLDTRRYLNNFLIRRDVFTLSNLSKMLHGAGAHICTILERFHDVCFDEDGDETQTLRDFHEAGFAGNDLSNVLSMAGSNAAFVLESFHRACFGERNLLDHFLTRKKTFTPKILSSILHGAGVGVSAIFKKLHDLCFDAEGRRTEYLKNLLKKERNNIAAILHERVKKGPPPFLRAPSAGTKRPAPEAPDGHAHRRKRRR